MVWDRVAETPIMTQQAALSNFAADRLCLAAFCNTLVRRVLQIAG
jgi:hypothetical protein